METEIEHGPTDATVTQQMAAVVLDRFGGIEQLQLRRIDLPQVDDDDVLIRLAAAGVGSWDAVEREGDYDGAFGVPSPFPYVLGWDGAGTVAAIGRNVTAFEVGDRVYAATTPVPRGGFYGEYGVAEADHVARIPDRMSTEQAAALPWDALTALSGLDLLALQPGQSLMIFGASGGIGHLALQLARAHRLRVLAVASGDDGVELATRLGADAVVDGRRQDVLAAASAFAPDGLDAALVTVGGPTTERSLRAVKSTGRIAWPNGVEPAAETRVPAPISHYDGDRSRAATDRLNQIIEAGSLEVHVAETFPLERVQDAHRALRTHYIGKLALRVTR